MNRLPTFHLPNILHWAPQAVVELGTANQKNYGYNWGSEPVSVHLSDGLSHLYHLQSILFIQQKIIVVLARIDLKNLSKKSYEYEPCS